MPEAAVPAVSVVVAVPVELVTPDADESVPAEVVKVMVAPATGLPLESVAVAVMVALVLPSAAMLAALEATAMVLTVPVVVVVVVDVGDPEIVSLPQAASNRAAAAPTRNFNFRIVFIPGTTGGRRS
jgi:hypothetical protein